MVLLTYVSPSFYFIPGTPYIESGSGRIVEVYSGDKYEEKDILPASLPFSDSLPPLNIRLFKT
jgi:hypothetical protein